MKRYSAVALKLISPMLLALGITVSCIGQGVVIPNEYWIEPTTNGLDLGTLDNPFYGNNQATFDYVMSNLVTSGNVVIHILAGTYQTAGILSYTIGPNTMISGSGMDSTIIKFALTGQSYGGVLKGGSSSDHVTIQDLTVDCNGQSNIFADGVDLPGNFDTIRRVKVINPIGSGTSESFPLALGNVSAKDHIVEDCVVSNCLGTYGDAISVSGGNSCILNCRAYLPVGSWMGINCAAFHNTKIIGNHVNGGITGFYMDTDPGDGIILQGNTFNRMNYAIQFNNGSPITNILVIGNVIHLGTNVATYPNHAICFSGVNSYSVQIAHNIIVGNNTGRGDDNLMLWYVNGGTVAGNTFDNRLTVNVASSSTNIWMFNNIDQNGNYAAVNAGTTSVGLPNPVRRIETTSNYTISLNDYFVGVKTNAIVTITLPSAGYAGSGKTYVVQDESGGPAGIIIAAQGGQSINGAPTKTITSPYSAITLVSDGNTEWYAR